MTPRELLLKAADCIAERGHWKGSYSKPGVPMSVGAVCAYGAMSWVATEGNTVAYSDSCTWSEDAEKVIDQAARMLHKQIPRSLYENPFNAITYYNDREDTSAEDVILAMKRAAGA